MAGMRCDKYFKKGLVNPEKDFNQITGFLKVSINIVAEGDR